MIGRTRIFISYKTGADTGLNFQANLIRHFLEDEGYEVWMDTKALAAGVDWNKQIYDQIPRSDILLLLLANETAASDWVRREIDVAKGAKVTILPVLIRGDFDKQEALDRFDIPRLQFVSLLNGDESEFDKLIEAIENLEGETQSKQKEWLHLLREGKAAAAIEPADKSVAVFKLGSREVHLAGGNMAEMNDIDVFVNSENDYLQMARVFEAKTISSVLRYRGSHIDQAQRLVEDTVQDELNQRVVENFRTRPVGKSTVIVTSAGHPKGKLRTENHARFIFHTATVSVQGDGYDKRLEPIVDGSGLKAAVRNTLNHIRVVDDLKGLVSPSNTERAKEQESEKDRYKPIESIIIPAFGTGRGGRPLFEVAPWMIRAIKEFLIDHEDDETLKLQRVHFCVFSRDDVNEVRKVLEEEFTGSGSIGSGDTSSTDD